MFVNVTEKHIANAKKVYSVYYSFSSKENGEFHSCVIMYDSRSYYSVNFSSEEESIKAVSDVVDLINNTIGDSCVDFNLVLLSPDFAVRRKEIDSITVRSADGSATACFSMDQTDVYRKVFESEKDAVDYINKVMNCGK